MVFWWGVGFYHRWGCRPKENVLSYNKKPLAFCRLVGDLTSLCASILEREKTDVVRATSSAARTSLTTGSFLVHQLPKVAVLQPQLAQLGLLRADQRFQLRVPRQRVGLHGSRSLSFPSLLARKVDLNRSQLVGRMGERMGTRGVLCPAPTAASSRRRPLWPWPTPLLLHSAIPAKAAGVFSDGKQASTQREAEIKGTAERVGVPIARAVTSITAAAGLELLPDPVGSVAVRGPADGRDSLIHPWGGVQSLECTSGRVVSELI